MGQIRLTPAQKDIVVTLFEKTRVAIPESKQKVVGKLVEKKVVKWVVVPGSKPEAELTPEGRFMFPSFRRKG